MLLSSKAWKTRTRYELTLTFSGQGQNLCENAREHACVFWVSKMCSLRDRWAHMLLRRDADK